MIEENMIKEAEKQLNEERDKAIEALQREQVIAMGTLTGSINNLIGAIRGVVVTPNITVPSGQINYNAYGGASFAFMDTKF